jgi:hypothetical protein
MVGLVRALGGRFETSLWCGFAFAVTPLLVRFGHTDSPFPVDALFSLLTFLGVARYARDLDDRWLLVALASVVTVAQMRLESIADAGLALLLAVALSPGFPWRDRRTWSAVLAAIVLLVPHAWLMADQLLYELSYRYDDVEEQRDRFGLTHYLFFNPTMQARLLIVALPLGLLHAELSWRVRLWAFASMMLVGSVLLTAHPHETSYAIARYQLRAMPHAALLAGLGMAWLVNRFPSPVMRLALIGGCLASLPMAARPSLLTREHEVFREHLPAVGSPCTVLTLLDDKDTTLAPPVHLSKLGGYDHVWLDVTRDAVPTEGCVAYWKSSTCTMHYLTPAVQTGDRAPACADFERAWMLEPIGEAELEPDPYGPMGLRVQRPDELVPVGFYRVTGRRLLP